VNVREGGREWEQERATCDNEGFKRDLFRLCSEPSRGALSSGLKFINSVHISEQNVRAKNRCGGRGRSCKGIQPCGMIAECIP